MRIIGLILTVCGLTMAIGLIFVDWRFAQIVMLDLPFPMWGSVTLTAILGLPLIIVPLMMRERRRWHDVVVLIIWWGLSAAFTAFALVLEITSTPMPGDNELSELFGVSIHAVQTFRNWSFVAAGLSASLLIGIGRSLLRARRGGAIR